MEMINQEILKKAKKIIETREISTQEKKKYQEYLNICTEANICDKCGEKVLQFFITNYTVYQCTVCKNRYKF